MHLRAFLALFLAINVISYTALAEHHGSHAGQNQPMHQDVQAIDAHHGPDGHGQKFDAGEMIFSHIGDAHDWHIITLGHHHVSIPLPVILYDQGKWVTFCYSKLSHGHQSYQSYKLETSGALKGKIVKALPGTMETDLSAPVPVDLSITKNVMALFVSVGLLLLIFLSVARSYRKNQGKAPKGLQSLVEPLIIFIRDDVAKPAIGEKKYERYLPFLLTIFFFIFINNLMGIIPIFPFGANVTGSISVTLVLAVFAFVITTFSGNKNYWLHIFWTPGVPWWLKVPVPLMPVVEIMGVFIKPFVLMVRLFANITAGHIIILGFMSLIFIFGEIHAAGGYGVSVISVAFSVFMNLLELLVAFIQAYVFTLLSAMYFGMATEEHH